MQSRTTATLGTSAYESLRERILTGALKPGQRLTLRALSQEVGTSLAPIGEALQRLAGDGLVSIEPRWGARVERLDETALREQHILRAAIESEAARQCAANTGAERLDELARAAAELDACIDGAGPASRMRALDGAFHLQLARASGVDALAEALARIEARCTLAIGIATPRAPASAPPPPRQHLKLVEAVRSRDGERAAREMRAHCLGSMRHQLQVYAAGQS